MLITEWRLSFSSPKQIQLKTLRGDLAPLRSVIMCIHISIWISACSLRCLTELMFTSLIMLAFCLKKPLLQISRSGLSNHMSDQLPFLQTPETHLHHYEIITLTDWMITLILCPFLVISLIYWYISASVLFENICIQTQSHMSQTLIVIRVMTV